MARTIMVEPAKLEQAAAKMDSQIADYERVYKLLFSEVDGMGAAWQGADNQAFVNQIRGFMDNFNGMTMEMRRYSEFLKHSAKSYRQTQQEIISSAKGLKN